MANDLRHRLHQRWLERIRPLEARRALQRLLANPDQTEHVFAIIRALSGSSFRRLHRRMQKDPQGTRILRERRDLVPLLSDRERLLALPSGSLGHQYGRFVEAEQISADGLVEASLAHEAPTDIELTDKELDGAAFGARMRDSHDLWHVVTGYNRDMLGELALLAFTYQQTHNPGIGYIVRTVERRMRRGGNREISSFLSQARQRGRDAAFLPAADWETLLERPLEEVRSTLRVGNPVSYEERRSPAGEAAVAS